jgi:hypothetical protein
MGESWSDVVPMLGRDFLATGKMNKHVDNSALLGLREKPMGV